MKNHQFYTPEILSTVRSLPLEQKTTKLITKIGKGKTAQAALVKSAGFAHSKVRVEQDVTDVAVSFITDFSDFPTGYDSPIELPRGLSEKNLLTLLENGLPINSNVSAWNRKRNLLTYAASQNFLDVAKYLLENGADPNANGCIYKGKEGLESMVIHLTPLHYAWIGGGEEIREVLIAAGANAVDESTDEQKKQYINDFHDVVNCELHSRCLKVNEIAIKKKGGAADASDFVSRFGGKPNMPQNLWPSSDAGQMSFVAQFNLAELKHAPLPLPETGALLFFVDAFPHQEGRVVYLAESVNETADGPASLGASYPMKFKRPNDGTQRPFANNFYFPHYTEQIFANAASNPIKTVDLDEVRDGFTYQIIKHQIGGHPYLIQNDCRRDMEGTILPLLQIDQVPGERKPLWGDNGIGHFFCDLDAIRAKDFSKAFFDWSCP